MFEIVHFPHCTALLLERWDAPPGRFFAAYLAREDFRSLAGHAVVDEFATLSSPIFLTPRALLGKVYNAGLSLGHRRDPEMGIDLGWPPLCLGLDHPAPELPEDWETELLAALTEPYGAKRLVPAGVSSRRERVDEWELESVRRAEATVMATDAPLLPRQLRRLCEASDSPLTVAVAVGNRLGRAARNELLTVQAVSEAQLAELMAAARSLWS